MYKRMILIVLLLITVFPLHAEELPLEKRVFISYLGKWNNILTRYSLPTVLHRAASGMDTELTIFRKSHGKWMRPLYYDSKYMDIQDNFFNYPGGVRDEKGIIKLAFFDQYINVAAIREYLVEKKITHIVIPGGRATSPLFFHLYAEPAENDYLLWRDIKELTVVLLAKELGLPVFAICRGMQLSNILFGGTIQLIKPGIAEPQGVDWNIHKRKSKIRPIHHSLFLINDTPLAEVYLPQNEQVNPILYSPWKVTSIHVRAVDEIAPYMEILAFTPITMPHGYKGEDPLGIELNHPYSYLRGFDVIEAISYKGSDFWLLGTQFHPEFLSRSPRSIRLFQHFLRQ